MGIAFYDATFHYLVRMRQIQRADTADYSTTMFNSDRIFIAARLIKWSNH